MLLFCYALSVTLMIALPVALAVALRRRVDAAWWLFCVGMATFAASQMYHLPLNRWLAEIGLFGRASPGDPNFVRVLIVGGLSAGVCESLARAIGYWLLFWRRQANRRQDAVMIGLGHGGLEAMAFGAVAVAATVSSLWTLRGQDLLAAGIPADQLSIVQQQLAALESPPLAFAPLVERGIAIAIHVCLSLLVWSAFKRRNLVYLAAAVLYHSAIDALAFGVGQSVRNIWAAEGILALVALPGVIWAWRCVRADLPPRRPVEPVASELALFGVATRKELLQHWRTGRALVVLAIFVLAGLGSPLLARFTPQILRSLPGAEQFADLIPAPGVADAVAQYIKNLTQFGLVIAVLVGMGAVVGEKEKGAAALIMSKPLPRWAFIAGKFVAQALLYLLAFFVAALADYYYTAILFEPLALGPFILGNVLLWIWLLVFAAVTLLSSVIAPSTAAAGGIGFGGAALVLLAGNLPYIGPLMPGALVTWAGQLGLVAGVAPNGGALTASLVLIVICVIGAIAAFEVQEL